MGKHSANEPRRGAAPKNPKGLRKYDSGVNPFALADIPAAVLEVLE